MMSIKSRFLLLGVTSILTLSACNADDHAKAPAADKGAAADAGAVAATVDGMPISKSRVDLLVKQRTQTGQPDSPELRKAVIDQLAIQTLISQDAVKKGLDKGQEIADQLELARQSILANAYVQDFIKNTPVSDDILKAEYDKLKAQMTGTEYKARHILVEKESEAKDIIAKLKRGAKFDELAKQKSKDPGSKDNGGDLGWFDTRSMVPEFGQAVSKLQKGKFTTEPVKTQFGYHVIQLEDSRPTQVPPFEQVKPGLTQQIQQQNLRKLIEDMKAKAKIVMVEAPAPAKDEKAAAPAKNEKAAMPAKDQKAAEPAKK